MVIGLLAGSVSAWDGTGSASTGTIRGRVDLPRDVLDGLRTASVAFGGQESPLAAGTFEVGAADGRVGLIEVLDAQDRVVVTGVVPQSDDWRFTEVVIGHRSTAAAIVLTTVGVASADPYLDALLLAGLEQSPLLDEAATRVARAAAEDPDWYERRDEVIADLVPELVDQALAAIESGFAAEAGSASGPVVLGDMVPTSFEITPVVTAATGRPSCDGSAMGDVDGVERDGVCLFPVSPAVTVGEPDEAQMFVAENRTTRWVVLFAGDAAVPVALVPPLRWRVPHARTLARLVAESSTTTRAVSWARDQFALIGIEYLREDATFTQKLELALVPYTQAPLTHFTVPGPLVAGGLTTAAFGTAGADGGDDLRVLAGSTISTFLTLTTELIVPTAAIALNVQRRTDTTGVTTLGPDAPTDSCLAGLEPLESGLGGSLLDILALPPDRALSPAEVGCRTGRLLRMTIVDELLGFVTDNEAVARGATIDLAEAALAGSVTAIAEASVRTLQDFAAAMTESQVLQTILTVELFGDDVGTALREGMSDAVLAEFGEFSRAVGRDLLAGQGSGDPGATRNPFRRVSAAARTVVVDALGDVLRRRATTTVALSIASNAAKLLAGVLRVEALVNTAIDAVNVGISLARLHVDLREYGVRDAYVPLMRTSRGDPTVANLPSYPEILWRTSTDVVPDDSIGFYAVDGGVALRQRLINRDDYGLLIALDAAGRPTTDSATERIRVTIDGDEVVVRDTAVIARLTITGLLAAAGHPADDQTTIRRRLKLTTGVPESGTVATCEDCREAGETLYAFVLGVPLDSFWGLIGAPPNPRLAVVITDAGTLVLSAVEGEIRQIDFSGTTPYTSGYRPTGFVDRGLLLTQYEPDGRLRTTFGPSSISGSSSFELSGNTMLHRRDSGIDARIYLSGDPEPAWRATVGTSCAEVDGPNAPDDPAATCRRVERWLTDGSYLVGAYVQGGFEVRSTTTGSRILVDAAEWGASITDVAVEGDRLYVGDGRGTVRVVDLGTERGDRTGSDRDAAIRLDPDGSLTPITALVARGGELYVASDTTRRLYRFRETDEGVWRQDWVLPFEGVERLAIDAGAVYVLQGDGTVTAVR